MGVGRSAMCVVGVDVSGKLAKKIQKIVPNCEHTFDSIHCPICGKQKGTTTKTEIVPTTEIDYGEDGWQGFEIIWQSGYDDAVDGNIYIGYRYCTDDQPMKIKEDLVPLKKHLKKALEPLGLWDETAFGIYVMTRWS